MFNIVVEDELSEIIVRRLFIEVNHDVGYVYKQNGFGYIKRNLKGFNNAAVCTPYFVLTDLDKHTCAATLWSEWLNTTERNRNLLFRVAVHEVESWLLGDYRGIARFLKTRKEAYWHDTDTLPEPKEVLLALAETSRVRKIREALVYRDDQNRLRQGPDYNANLGKFVMNEWDISSALEHSDSLHRAIDRLKAF